MTGCIILDAFSPFTACWTEAEIPSLDEQIERWHAFHRSQWPELVKMQSRDYAAQGYDWREIAREHVFPFLAARMSAMAEAHGHLLACLPGIDAEARRVLDLRGEVIYLIHVGIGCGAGWATSYAGRPAVLFGLENIAECGWTEPGALTALAAHELGHLHHLQMRRRTGETDGRGPLWQLYAEGFAQRCEHRLMGRESWHEQEAGKDWLSWCQTHQSWLAGEFLRRLAETGSCAEFFGSWLTIHGPKQTGYYLGHAMIAAWEEEMDLSAIAVLSPGEVDRRATGILLGWSRQGLSPPIGEDRP